MSGINLGDRVRIRIPKKFRLTRREMTSYLPRAGLVVGLNYKTINPDRLHGGAPQYVVLDNSGNQYRIPKDWCRRIEDGE